MNLTLPTDSDERKDVPVLSGCMNYFPAALAWIARISVKGDRKHNPENAGNPPFHARGKSMDHGDCIVRHTMDIEDLKAHLKRTDLVPNNSPAIHQLLEEAAYRAWRSCAELQQLCEDYGGAPLAPAARLPGIPPLKFGTGWAKPENEIELRATRTFDDFSKSIAGLPDIGDPCPSELRNAEVALARVAGVGSRKLEYPLREADIENAPGKQS